MRTRSILGLWNVNEMANTRKGPTWAVLDWAAKQAGTFSLRDMYNVYVRAGGGTGEGAFATLINKLIVYNDPQTGEEVARYPNYRFGAERPIRMIKAGRRGKGGAAEYEWGMDGPLRDPETVEDGPKEDSGEHSDDQMVLDAIERIGQHVRPGDLKVAIRRWKALGDHHRVAADIRRTMPPRAQIDALYVAMDALHNMGKASQAEVDEAEPEDAGAGTETPRTPFTPAKPRAQANQPTARQPKRAPRGPLSPEDVDAELDRLGAPRYDDDASDEGGSEEEPETPAVPSEDDEDDDMAGWGTPIPNEDEPTPAPQRTPMKAAPESKPEDEEESEELSDDDVEDVPDEPADDDEDDDDEPIEWPDWLPDPKDGGRGGRAMEKLVDHANLDPGHPIWEQLWDAKNDVDAHRIIRKSGIDQNLHGSLLAVARSIFEHDGRDWETGKKNESRLLGLWNLRESDENLNEAGPTGSTLSLAQVDTRFPGATAAFDRDVAMNSTGNPSFRVQSDGSLVVSVGLGGGNWGWNPETETWKRILKPGGERARAVASRSFHMIDGEEDRVKQTALRHKCRVKSIEHDSPYMGGPGGGGTFIAYIVGPPMGLDAIAQELGFDYELGNEEDPGADEPPHNESRLLSLWNLRNESADCGDGIDEVTTDDIVPSPEKRGQVGVQRLLPNYGMDEGPRPPQSPPTDFSVQSGLQRVVKMKRRK